MRFLIGRSAIIVGLVAMLSVFGLSGCSYSEILIPKTFSELSLVDLWNRLSEATGVQKDSEELESLHLHVDADGVLDTLSLRFYGTNNKGRSTIYIAEMNAKGLIDWHSYETEPVLMTRHPMKVFFEIDRLGLSSLQLGEDGLSLYVDFQSGDVGYDYMHVDIYQLDEGNLRPLNKIIFHSATPWCTISIFELNPSDIEVGLMTSSYLTPPDSGLPKERTSQVWFLSEDLNKASVLEFLLN